MKSQEINCDKESFGESCLKTIPSTNFMKILLYHIIQNTIFMINIGIAIFIVINHHTSEKPFYYGLALLILPFIMNLFILSNECYYKTDLVATSGRYKLKKCIVIITLFQHMPIMIFLLSICGLNIKENFTKRIMMINSTQSSIYICFNNIVLIFLLMRGDVSLDNKTCFVDDLGRTICIIYPVIVSTIIGFMFIITTNIQKLTSNKYFLIPMLLVVTCYRTIGISFIITYLDFWSIIPLLIIFATNTMIKLYREFPEDKDNDEIDAATGLVWDGDVWVGLQASSNALDTTNNSNKQARKANDDINILIRTLEHTITPILSEIAIITDSCLLITIISTSYLVNIDENFNYEENMLNNHSFNLVVILSSSCSICKLSSSYYFIV